MRPSCERFAPPVKSPPTKPRLAHVHVKVNGFVDKVFVDYVGQLVKKGQPLFTLYSPDLVATQQEYLIAKSTEKTLGASPFPEVAQGSQSLLRSARERLKLWDISDDQIKKLDETGEVNRTLTFYSPVSGFVMDRKAFPQTSVTPDTELYTVSDLSTDLGECGHLRVRSAVREGRPARRDSTQLLSRQDLEWPGIVHLSDCGCSDPHGESAGGVSRIPASS